MTYRQMETIRKLRREIKELHKKVTRLKVIDNEVFRKDHKIIMLEKKVESLRFKLDEKCRKEQQGEPQ